MKRSLREILAAPVSPVAIAVLLLSLLDSGWNARNKVRADAIGCRLHSIWAAKMEIQV